MAENEATQVIPGFSPEQSWAMNIVAEQAAERAIEKLRANGCPVSGCDERKNLIAVVFGATERGVVGLDQRVADLERTNANLRRVAWVAISGCILSVIGLVFTLIQFAILGGI